MKPEARQWLFRVLLLFYISMSIWAVYSLWTRTISLFVGILLLIGALALIRSLVLVHRKYPPVVVDSTLDLAIPCAADQRMTPDFVAELLGKERVLEAIENDLKKTGQIGATELWRLGLLTSEQDRYDPRLFQLSRSERFNRARQDPNVRYYLLGKIPVRRTAVLHSTTWFKARLNNLAVTGGSSRRLIPGVAVRSYGLSTKMGKGEVARFRDMRIAQASARGRSQLLLRFLQEDGFPLKESYADADPLTAERGGVIVNDSGKIIVIYPNYYVQRRLIDEQGNLVYMGLDEDFTTSTMFQVNIQPSVSRLLLHAVSSNGYVPILRYRSFPYASDFMLPILDTPMSTSGWAELFVDTRGKAKLFIAKEKPEPEWQEMMNRLKQLLYDELAKTDYHFLGLAADEARRNHYLAKKQEILADYFVIQDWALP